MEQAVHGPDDARPPAAPGCPAGPRLAAELRILRTRTGKSLKELEELVHASDSSISRYLSGRIVPPWPVVARLSRLAGDDPARLRPLWEHVDGERHRQGDCPPPPPETAADAGRAAPTAPAAPLAPAGLPEDAPAAAAPDGTAARRRPAPERPRWLVVAGLMAGTAVVSGTAGVLAGERMAPRRIVAAQQFAVCRDWPWPGRADGQVPVPPAAVHGRDHTPAVRLLTNTIGGRQMVWAQITGARYGDRVWMDWSRDDGKTWTQCGPFLTTGATFSSRAHAIGPGWHFRACGDTPRQAVPYPRNACTEYW